MADDPYRVTGDRSAPPVIPLALHPDGHFYPSTQDHPFFVRAGEGVNGEVGLELGGANVQKLLCTQKEILVQLEKMNQHLSLLTEANF